MAARKIKTEWLERALNHPSLVERHDSDPELEHRFARIDEWGGRVLHLVVARAHPERVITVYFDRTRKELP